MSVHPIQLGADGSLQVLHDECGTITPLTPAQVDVNVPQRTISLKCSRGDGQTLWPVSGGEDADMAQRMFTYAIMRLQGRTWAQARNIIRAFVAAQDGPGRFVVPAQEPIPAPGGTPPAKAPRKTKAAARRKKPRAK
jgi:hypothetical protein